MLWYPIAVLPNVELREAIETSDAAFVPLQDARIEQIATQHANFRTFLEAFSDAFGEVVAPTILLYSPAMPSSFNTVDAIASVRDILAASIIPRARSRTIQGLHLPGITYSNSFDFYPWMLDIKFVHLIGITPAIRAIHEVQKFNGQSLPDVPRFWIDKSQIDAPLFNELARRWRDFYKKRNVSSNLALMRSLNMAFHASKLPAGLDATYLDDGRLVGLWVSAFEILAHPGAGQKSGQQEVMRLLESVRWKFKRNNIKNIKCKFGNKVVPKAPPSWVYYRLNGVRNDFLHGNPVTRNTGMLPKIKRSVEHFAAPLYRLALTAFLNLHWMGALPPVEDTEAFAQACCDRWEFEKHQGEMEKAIILSRGPTAF